MSQFSDLKPLLENIATQCSYADDLRGGYHLPLFDRSLFKCRAKKLLPCALEAKATFQTIIHEQSSGQLSNERAQYLTDKLMNQITALQRELVSHELRQDKPLENTQNKSINELYNDLAQHQDWSHRLKQLVSLKQQALNDSPAGLKPQAEQALDIAEQRLSRCQDAMNRIEQLINLENPNRYHD